MTRGGGGTGGEADPSRLSGRELGPLLGRERDRERGRGRTGAGMSTGDETGGKTVDCGACPAASISAMRRSISSTSAYSFMSASVYSRLRTLIVSAKAPHVSSAPGGNGMGRLGGEEACGKNIRVGLRGGVSSNIV